MKELTDDEKKRVKHIRDNFSTRHKWLKVDYEDFYYRDILFLLNLLGEKQVTKKIQCVEIHLEWAEDKETKEKKYVFIRPQKLKKLKTDNGLIGELLRNIEQV